MVKMSLEEALTLALTHYQAGQTAEAESLCRAVLEYDPRQFDALRILGLAVFSSGDAAAAEGWLRQAMAVRPELAVIHDNLATALAAQGRRDEAEAEMRSALALDPNDAIAACNLGALLNSGGHADEAERCFRRAIEIQPDMLTAISNLAHLLSAQRRYFESIDAFCAALQLAPESAVLLLSLAGVLERIGRFTEAEAACREALRVRPELAEAESRLAALLAQQGRFDEAESACRRALALQPDLAHAHHTLAGVLLFENRSREAEAASRSAVELDPTLADAWSNLGLACQFRSALAEAEEAYRRAMVLQQDAPEESAGTHNNLGTLLRLQGRLDEAEAEYRTAMRKRAGFHVAHSNLLCSRQYQPEATLAELAQIHAEWNRAHALPLAGQGRRHVNRPDAERTLRVGLVSADLAAHPVGYFSVAMLEKLDPRQIEIHGYSDRITEDDLTRRIASLGRQWMRTRNLSDDALAEQIRSDEIDILFDLAGHTAGNRLLCFARKPAPIQITWLGYVGTTGVTAIDYILADRHQIPPEAEPFYAERVLRMPGGYVCFEPPSEAPPIGPVPSSRCGYVTLAAFHNPSKITRQVIGVWAEILRRLPRSRLILKYTGFDDPTVGPRYRALFEEQGISSDRLDVEGWTPRADLLGAYNRTDLALDTFPYGGGLTTCEALWMGAPVVTCPGETFASRHALSHLATVGLAELVARDHRHYVDLAVELAEDRARLKQYRKTLRRQVAGSPLCDAPRFAAAWTDILRGVWRQWCAG